MIARSASGDSVSDTLHTESELRRALHPSAVSKRGEKSEGYSSGGWCGLTPYPGHPRLLVCQLPQSDRCWGGPRSLHQVVFAHISQERGTQDFPLVSFRLSLFLFPQPQLVSSSFMSTSPHTWALVTPLLIRSPFSSPALPSCHVLQTCSYSAP